MPGVELGDDVCYLSQHSQEIWRADYHLDFADEENRLREAQQFGPGLTYHRAEQVPETRTPEVQHATSLIRHYPGGENVVFVFNWGIVEWKWGGNQKLLQNDWQSYSQLTKNKAGIHFADVYLTM